MILPIAVLTDAIPRGEAGASTTETTGDTEFSQTIGTTTWNDYQVEAGDLEENVVLTNLSPGVGSLESGLLTRVTDGLCRIRATRGGASKNIYLNLSETPGTTLRVFTGYVAGSTADTLATGLLDLVNDAASGRYYSEVLHTAGIYSRNPASWASSIDLSGVSVGSDTNSPTFSRRSPATLIDDGTRRHVVGAKHWNVYHPFYAEASGWVEGTKLRFVTASGVVVVRTVSGLAYFGDIVVATLDSALPETITPLKIAGSWVAGAEEEFSPGVWRYTLAGAAFFIDQNMDCRFVLLGSLTGYIQSTKITEDLDGGSVTSYSEAHCMSRESVLSLEDTPAFLSGKTGHMYQPSGGDSGNPLMLVIEGEPVLLWTWWHATGGPPLWTAGLLEGLIADADADAGASTTPSIVYATDPTA